jgi:biopolymer transport protein ExbB/TolQ
MEYIFSIITIVIFGLAVWRELYIVRERISYDNVLIKVLDPKCDYKFTHPNKLIEAFLQSGWGYINDYSDLKKSDLVENARNKEDIFIRCKNSLSRPTPRSEVHFIPSVLTSMGLLGTFWGIQIALSKLDPKKLEVGVDTLLGGMKTAFMSSLFGLGCAAFFIIFLAFSTYAQNIYRKYLRKRLSNLNYMPRSDKDVSTELINAAEKMQSLDSKSIGVQVGKALFPIFNKISEELESLREFKADRGQDILKELKDEFIVPISFQLKESATSTKEASEAVISLKNELVSVSKDLALSIITIQEFQGKTLSQLEVFANNLSGTLVDFQTGTKDVLKEVGEEIKRGVDESIVGMKSQREAFSDSANQASQTFTGIRTELEAVLSTQTVSQEKMLQNVGAEIKRGVDESIISMKAQQQAFSDSTNQASQTFTDIQTKLESALTTQTESQEKMLQNVGAEIKRGVEESIISMKAQQEAFSDSTTQAANTFRDIRTELELALTKQTASQEQMLQNVKDRMNTILSNTHQAFEQQSNTLELVGDKASKLMDTAGNNLLSTLGNIDGMLQNTRQTVQDELNNFRETYQESLDKFFKEQNNLLESTLGTQRQGLSDVVIELQIAFQEEADRRKQLSQQLDDNLEKIQRTAGVVSKLVNTVGLHDGARIAQMQELSQEMGTQINNLERSYRSLNTRYEESLRIGNEQLSEYFQRAIVHEHKFFEEADSSTAKLCNTLLKAADYLVATEKTRRQEQGDN